MQTNNVTFDCICFLCQNNRSSNDLYFLEVSHVSHAYSEMIPIKLDVHHKLGVIIWVERVKYPVVK